MPVVVISKPPRAGRAVSTKPPSLAFGGIIDAALPSGFEITTVGSTVIATPLKNDKMDEETLSVRKIVYTMKTPV